MKIKQINVIRETILTEITSITESQSSLENKFTHFFNGARLILNKDNPIKNILANKNLSLEDLRDSIEKKFKNWEFANFHLASEETELAQMKKLSGSIDTNYEGGYYNFYNHVAMVIKIIQMTYSQINELSELNNKINNANENLSILCFLNLCKKRNGNNKSRYHIDHDTIDNLLEFINAKNEDDIKKLMIAPITMEDKNLQMGIIKRANLSISIDDVHKFFIDLKLSYEEILEIAERAKKIYDKVIYPHVYWW